MNTRLKFSGNLYNDILATNGMDEIDYEYIDYDMLVYKTPKSKRLVDFIASHNRVVFCSDADADGISAAKVAKECYPNAIYVFGDRNGERGLTPNLFEEINSFYQPDAIITLDCGISNFDGINLAKSNGVDVFVTDHHQPEQTLPDCEIINPWLESYDFKALCGAGVIYAALSDVYGANDNALQYAALGTICDVVPVICDNRYLIRQGLKLINSAPTNGIRQTLNALHINGTITEKKIGWYLGPAINAASRLNKTNVAVSALLDENPDSALGLNELNTQRKKLTIQAIEEADITVTDGIVIAITKNNEIGIAGLIANRLGNAHYRPACVMSLNGAAYKASLRTGDYWSAVDLIQGYDIITGGGHFGAAGFTFAKKDLQQVIEYIINYSQEAKSRYESQVKYSADIEISLDDAIGNFADIQALSPYGQSFSIPTFMSTVTLDSMKSKYTQNMHLSFQIGNTQAYYYNPPSEVVMDSPINIVYEVEYSDWKKKPQIVILKTEGETK